jgi:hypothetical protein
MLMYGYYFMLPDGWMKQQTSNKHEEEVPSTTNMKKKYPLQQTLSHHPTKENNCYKYL